MPTVKRFEDLKVWQDARASVNDIYELTRRRPFKEDRALCWRTRDAAISVMSNIAEGFERGSNKEFIQALFISRGSAGEVRSQLYPALDQQYITGAVFDDRMNRCEALSRQIVALIEYLKHAQFKGDKFREERATYLIDAPGASQPGI